MIEPLNDDAMDETINSDPRREVVSASEDPPGIHPRSQIQSDLDALVPYPCVRTWLLAEALSRETTPVRTSSIKSAFTDSSVRPTRRAPGRDRFGSLLSDDRQQVHALEG
jgi:hypothetical protein